jgi:NADPH:quinone reductase-like Zn-dependent oxidoreductase
MRAVRFHQPGRDPVVDDIPEPVRGAGEVLVGVQAATVAHLDVTVATGEFGMQPPLPYIAGVEGAGVVLAADPESGLEVGAQVVLRGGGLGTVRDGTWTEKVSVAPKALLSLPVTLPPEVAASFFAPTTTGYVAVHDVARIHPGERVVVTGAAGAVGSMVVQQALAAGAEVVAAVRPSRIPELPTGVVPLDLSDTEAQARLDSDRSADVLIDTVGGSELFRRSRWVRPGGRAAAIGYTAGEKVELDLPTWLLDDVALLPVNMMHHGKRSRAIAGDLATDLAAGRLRIPVEQFDLTDTARALAALRSGSLRGRAVILPG